MGKRQRHRSNISKHIKSTHKKSTINRKVAYTKVDKTLKNINQIISKQMDKTKRSANNQGPQNHSAPKIQLQTISADQLKRLLGGQKDTQKQKSPRINLDETLILEKLIKKWNTSFVSMAKDIKLNRMQWTAKQVEKKYDAYQKLLQEEQQQNQHQ